MRGLVLGPLCLLFLLVAAPAQVATAPDVAPAAYGDVDGTWSLLEAIPAVPIASSGWTVPTHVEGVASDGLRIEVVYWPLWDKGHEMAPDVRPFNLAPDVLQWTLDNHEEFLEWGFTPEWGEDHVTVWIDDPKTPCQGWGCAQDEEIWILSATPAAQLVWADVDEEEAYQRTLGHEMFHVVQKRVFAVNGHTTYVEGTARFQETLHTYSEAAHQPRSFIYSHDKNGCNGYDAYAAGKDAKDVNTAIISDMDLGMAIGPFTEKGEQLLGGKIDLGPQHGYDSCYFWLSWYGHHGIGPFVRLVENFTGTGGGGGYYAIAAAIEAATGEPIVNDYARFALKALTGRGYEWGPAAGPGPVLDWGEHLDRWAPAVLRPGEEASMELGSGGMMGRGLGASGNVTWTGDGTFGYVVRDGPNDAIVTPIAPSTFVEVGEGESVWAVMIHPAAGQVTATMALE